MSTRIGVKIGLCVATLIVFGGMFAALTAVQADDVPITVGKPIIKPDPPKPPKKDGDQQFVAIRPLGVPH